MTYWREGIRETWKNVRTILKVVVSAAVALALLYVAVASQRRFSSVYDVDAEFLKRVASADANGEAKTAVIAAADKLSERHAHPATRDELLASLLPEAMTKAKKVADVIAEGKSGLERQERAIADKRGELTAKQSEAAKTQMKVIAAQQTLSAARVALAELGPTEQRMNAATAKKAAADAELEVVQQEIRDIDKKVSDMLQDDAKRKLEAKRDAAERRREDAYRRSEEARHELRAGALTDVAATRQRVAAAEDALSQAARAATKASTELSTAMMELEFSIRDRNYTQDRLSLDLAALRDADADFAAECTRIVDKVVAERQQVLRKEAGIEEKSVPARPANAIFAQATAFIHQGDTPESSFHVVYQGFFFLCVIVVVLAIAFCAATLLKVLPFPGSAEKWSEKIESLAEKPEGQRSGKSAAASLLLTATTLGVGVYAAGHVLREPGGALSDEVRPVFAHEAPLSLSAAIPAPAAMTLPATSATQLYPPYQQSAAACGGPTFPTITFTPSISMSPAPVPPPGSPAPTINVTPAEIAGLDQLQAGVVNIGNAASAIDRTATEMKKAFDTESAKAANLQGSVDSAKAAFEKTTSVVDTNVLLTRLLMGDLAKEDETREIALGRLLGAKPRWWRSLLGLHKYQVTEGTVVLFGTESGCKEAHHEKLNRALTELRDAPPQYESLFEDAIIHKIATSKEDFVVARDEVRRHLPIILTSSLVAE